MTLSPQMKLKMEKIDSLIDKGYVLKTQFGRLVPNLISPQGKSINTFSGRYGDDPLAGFSWIAFFFPFALATQIRHWSYFWFVGIIAFILVSPLILSSIKFKSSKNPFFLQSIKTGDIPKYSPHSMVETKVKTGARNLSPFLNSFAARAK